MFIRLLHPIVQNVLKIMSSSKLVEKRDKLHKILSSWCPVNTRQNRIVKIILFENSSLSQHKNPKLSGINLTRIISILSVVDDCDREL